MLHRFLLFFVASILFSFEGKSQPYIDVANFRYWWMPGLRMGDDGHQHHYFNAFFDLPFKLNNENIIVLSPMAEHWKLDSTSLGNIPSVNGYILPVTWIHSFKESPWGFIATPIIRWNAEPGVTSDAFQFGGAGLATYKISDKLKFKLGCYVNDDFFGIFIVPLAGIDWHVNDNLKIFGVLPGRMTIEKRVTDRFYFGAHFRSITNSYRLHNGNYLRIDQNQIAAFIDVYMTKNLVANFDAGYSLLPEIRSGRGKNKDDSDLKDIDGMYLKISVAWRIRFDHKQ